MSIQKLAGTPAEELTDFKAGDHVMTVDGFPGRVTAVNFGPYPGTETYQIELDNAMGGGDYNNGQLRPMPKNVEASRVEAYETRASIPVEAYTDHTANIDYPELEDILEKRLPNENIKIYAARAINQDDKADTPEDTSDDPTENLEQDNDPEDDDVPPGDVDNPDEDPENSAGDAQPGDVTPPDACSYCGNASFSDPQMTGRGVRMRCDQCNGTMVSWGGQWQPEFPNSSQNHASEQWDYRSGGPGGIAQAPGAGNPGAMDSTTDKLEEMDSNAKTSVLQSMSRHQLAESLQSQSGIVSYLFNKLYEKARNKYERSQVEWWQPPANQVGTNLQGPAEYSLIAPKKVSIGSASELDDPDWRWHFTATWMDVQAKARRIRREGGVKIVSTAKTFVSAEVQGDTAVYETQLNYVPGTRKIADWACGCKWGAYTWGRSPQYQRFEGRLCSHALATQYEANSRGMFGKDVAPDTQRPSWQHAHSPVVVQYDRGKEKDLTRRAVPPANMRRTFSSYTLDSDGIYPEPRLIDLQHAPLYVSVTSALDNGSPFEHVIEMVASYDMPADEAKAMIFEALLSDVIVTGMSEYPEGAESGSDLTTEASVHTADYDSASPLVEYDSRNYQPSVQHSNSENPASTGWATSQDPGDWGRSLITNDFGVTFDAALHTSLKEGEGSAPTVSGVALKAADTGRVLMIQRSIKNDKDPAKGTFEFPGGHHEANDLTSLHAGIREWEEEVGQSFPQGGHVTHVHRSGPYALHTVVVPDESGVDFKNGRRTVNPDDPDGDDHEQSLWIRPEHAAKLPNLRNELKKSNPFDQIKKAADLDGQASQAAQEFEASLLDEAAFHDEPEPALPSTTGEEDVDADPGAGNSIDQINGERPFDTTSSIIEQFQRTAGGQALAAQVEGITKESMKDFSFNEQQSLINEGKGSRARNFGDLKIEGTHYALIPDDMDDDETVLWV